MALLEEYPDPDDETIRDYLAGNLYRRGSYINILAAVRFLKFLEAPTRLAGTCIASTVKLAIITRHRKINCIHSQKGVDGIL